jgi:hypothetical protein
VVAELDGFVVEVETTASATEDSNERDPKADFRIEPADARLMWLRLCQISRGDWQPPMMAPPPTRGGPAPDWSSLG